MATERVTLTDDERLVLLSMIGLTEPHQYAVVETLLAARESALRAQIKALTERAEVAERMADEALGERDALEERMDEFAYAVAPQEEIGEHSSGNDPWANALEILHMRNAARIAGGDTGV